MADNTRVNELQEKLLKAIDILNAQALNSISFDKTITCKIESDKNKKDGKYEVNDGNRIFTAYSTDTSFRVGDTVYVTVPEGKFENQKMIIGKKTADNDKPFNFVQPFDTFFDMTGNLAVDATAVEAVANYETHKNINILNIDVSEHDIVKYTRLAIRANFRSWIKNAVSGNYGIDVILTTDKPNTTTGDMKNGTYTYRFDSSMFYGNPYNFETYYSQELVLDLEKQDIGKVTGIKVDFYQDDPFKDKQGVALDSTEQDGSLLAPNLFVDNLEIYFGYDISTFTSDMVEIYTKDSLKFMEPQLKNILARWVHLKDGNPIDMIKKPDANVKYEIRWYKYILGCAAADEYCGVYWDRINPVSGHRLFYKDNKWYEKKFIDGIEQDNIIEELNTQSFTCNFIPDCKKNQEKIKCIVIVDNNIPYRSNEIIFENEKEVVDTSVQTFVNALQIKEDDNTNGNYMIYGQNNDLLDSEDTKIVRTLSAYFDADGDGKAESLIQPNSNLQWIIPVNNTMIIVQNGEIKDDKYTGNIKNEQPQYKIASHYSPGKSNNTIQCIYTNNDIVYITEKEFTFGPSGTMGTDQTIVIDFVGDTKALLIGTKTFQLQVQVYNNKNELLTDVPENITWSWMHCVKDSNDVSYLQIPNKEKGNEDKEKSHPPIIDITVRDGFDINQLYIIQVEVGDLITYFPIPIKSDINYSYITGATQVIYQSDGEPNYSKEIYNLCEFNGAQPEIPATSWRIKHHIPEDSYKEKQELYIGALRSYNNGQVLEPLSIYVKDAPVYGVQALASDETILWTQPILVLQNKWSSSVINKWDGKSLQLDEASSAVIAAAVSAGKKNPEDNTFSGVMIGDWSGKDLDTNQSIANQTGVYGFHHGAMSYAFKEDGTAFIGKYGDGRINFDGNNATLYSPSFETGQGMKIDLNDASIYMKYSGDIIKIDAGAQSDVSSFNDMSDAPFTIGTNFAVAWDGTIYATGGNFKGTISASTLQTNSTDDTIYLRGSITVQQEDENSDWQNGGKIGFLGSDYGGETEGGTGKNKGIGLNYGNTSVIKATNTNAGMSCADYYLSLQNINNTKKAVLRSTNNGLGRLVLDENHIGLGFGATGTNDNGEPTGGAFVTLQKDSNGNTEVVIGAAKISFNTPQASDQSGIYARFA